MSWNAKFVKEDIIVPATQGLQRQRKHKFPAARHTCTAPMDRPSLWTSTWDITASPSSPQRRKGWTPLKYERPKCFASPAFTARAEDVFIARRERTARPPVWSAITAADSAPEDSFARRIRCTPCRVPQVHFLQGEPEIALRARFLTLFLWMFFTPCVATIDLVAWMCLNRKRPTVSLCSPG